MHAGLSVVSPEQKSRVEIFCQFDFEVRARDTIDTEAPGHCWHNMFSNPILVEGFPIQSKPESGIGVEMPLDLLAGLVGASRAMGVQGKVVLKGFATMAVVVRRLGDLLIWHFLFDEEGKRISYLDVALDEACDMDVHQIDNARHVVGWSRNSSYYAGAKDANYTVEGSGLPSPHAGMLLEKLTINIGKIFTAGATIAPRQKLMWIEKKYVILWDEKTKRGWLVNGTSALLHLVRMSLKLYEKGNYCEELSFNKNKMWNATTYEPTSAAQVLKDRRNRNLEVWPGKNEKLKEKETRLQAGQEVSTFEKRKRASYSFENFVEQKYSVLEILMESHKQSAGLNGVNLKPRIRKHLEGWDFAELASESDPELRVATFKAAGYGWVNFVHSIKAITLFGRGFGDIIMPSKAENICPQWSQLPTGEYHLAASMADLNNIVRTFGKTRQESIEVVRGYLWHSPHDPFALCHCQDHGNFRGSPEPSIKHHSPVQMLFPKRLMPFPRACKPRDLNNSGAVVFGHIVSWGSGPVANDIDYISNEMQHHLYRADPQEAALERNIPEISVSLHCRGSKPLRSTYDDVSHPLHSANTMLTTPDESTSRHAVSPLAKRRNHANNGSDEEMEDDDESSSKMWWETSYPSRYVPTGQTAAENLSLTPRTG
ncbi:hypothetical protein GQ44DRAFT_720506 [Phaeosphaeriaceae sp. PMI808]|nr:hypothetical protein GQ44DRAFT_720506 [Phaeosphaeriaceae sp. PMI808]